MATSCGIAVILTMRATGTAMAAPTAMATRASTRFVVWLENFATGLKKVTTTATTAAAAARRLPLRACLGELSPLRATMNATAANRYTRSIHTGVVATLPMMTIVEAVTWHRPRTRTSHPWWRCRRAWP